MSFTVIVCTRDRPAVLLETLEALARQRERGFDVLVVDQSAQPDDRVGALLRREGWRALHDSGSGVARARNLGWRAAGTEWVVYMDDDVVPTLGWSAGLRQAMERCPEADVIMGDTPATGVPEGDYVVVSQFPVAREEVLSGRWLRPWLIGFTLNQAFRRELLEAMGGFDERLGAGAPLFPSSADMDINYRLLRAGGRAMLTPAARAYHNQWRPPADLGAHYERYMRGWSGFATKHIRNGDVLGGAWLWTLGALDMARMLGSAVRRRSRLRLRIAAKKARGLMVGTVAGLRHPW